MQGTMIMLLALSGLGCCHGHGHSVPVSACYDACYSGCYDACYSGCYDASYSAPIFDACYSGCFDMGPSCYSYNACYTSYGKHGGCGLFSCFKKLFHHKKKAYHACYSGCYDACYSACYDAWSGPIYSGCYDMPVYGSYTPAYVTGGAMWGDGQIIGGPIMSGQTPYMSGQMLGAPQTVPSSAAPAAPAAEAAPAPPAAPAESVSPPPAAEPPAAEPPPLVPGAGSPPTS